MDILNRKAVPRISDCHHLARLVLSNHEPILPYSPGQYRHTSETPFEWRFPGGPKVAPFISSGGNFRSVHNANDKF